MSLNEDIDRLSQVGLFDGFSIEQLRMLAFGSKRFFMRAGETVFDEGAISDGGYLVVTGQVDVVVNKQGREMVLASQLENSLIGEVALITPNKRMATAIARTNCELLFIPRELFRRMLSEYPELAARIHTRIKITVGELLEEMQRVHTRLQSIPDLAGSGDA